MIGSIDTLLNMFNAIEWLWYGTAIFGVIVMRLTRPHVERPFEVKWHGEGEEGDRMEDCKGWKK